MLKNYVQESLKEVYPATVEYFRIKLVSDIRYSCYTMWWDFHPFGSPCKVSLVSLCTKNVGSPLGGVYNKETWFENYLWLTNIRTLIGGTDYGPHVERRRQTTLDGVQGLIYTTKIFQFLRKYFWLFRSFSCPILWLCRGYWPPCGPRSQSVVKSILLYLCAPH